MVLVCTFFGLILWISGSLLAEHELRLIWGGYAYFEDPETGKVHRFETSSPNDSEDTQYAPCVLSWILYIPLRIRRHYHPVVVLS